MRFLTRLIRHLFIGMLIAAVPCGFVYADAKETADTTPPSTTVIHQGHYERQVSIPKLSVSALSKAVGHASKATYVPLAAYAGLPR